MTRLLLCTDLDRTLIPNGDQPESPLARPLFAKLAGEQQVTTAYVTGRHQALIQQAIQDYALPLPDFAIADVGATIYQVTGTRWQRWSDWDTHLAPQWCGASHEDLRHLLSGIAELTLQEPEKQAVHKLSFYTPLLADPDKLRSRVKTRLKAAGIRSNLIWSIDTAKQQGLLDILPLNANKLHAIEFLMAVQAFERHQTVFAGDSGNDLDVLLSGIPSVLVANADTHIKARVAHVPAHQLYLAKGDYLGMNGNYGAGILEGVAHYHPEVGHWLHQHIDSD